MSGQAGDQASKQPGELPDVVAVIGGGRMGAGIAHAFLAAGVRAVVVESGEAAARAAHERVAGTLGKAADRGRLDGSVDDAMARLRVAASLEAAGAGLDGAGLDGGGLAQAGLVIEAVPEHTETKVAVLAAAAALAPRAVLATNTSSLSIDAIADGLPDPARLVGLHFFNPVPVSDLVEIVVGARTPSAVVERAQGWVRALGRTAVTVTDSPGFASSRLGVAIALEAIRMLEEGVASADDIDTAMRLGYRHPVGPLRTTDLVGLDVRLAIAEHLERELGPRFAPPALLRSKVAAGELGAKSGQGFYAW